MIAAQRRRLSDRRWHFQHGPIDLIIGVEGDARAVDEALESAWRRFGGVLEELVGELPLLRSACPVDCEAPRARGAVAQRMIEACTPFARRFGLFVTPMAAVAGSVAQEIVASFAREGIDRAWVNNGGDVAFRLAPGASLDVGVVGNVDVPSVDGRLHLSHADPVRGLATSGWRGRSLSLGIADSVTVVAASAALADAAATLVANAVNVEHDAVRRAPASMVRDDSDLGERLVTIDVGALPAPLVDEALAAGADFARRCVDEGLAAQVLLSLQGRSSIVAGRSFALDSTPTHSWALA